jgi:hypothetical protein
VTGQEFGTGLPEFVTGQELQEYWKRTTWIFNMTKFVIGQEFETGLQILKLDYMILKQNHHILKKECKILEQGYKILKQDQQIL